MSASSLVRGLRCGVQRTWLVWLVSFAAICFSAARVCAQQPPQILSITTPTVLEDDGVRVFYTVIVSGTPPFNYNWFFFDGYSTNIPGSFSTTNVVSRFFGPFDPFPNGFSITVGNDFGSDSQGGSFPPPCGAICLSVGVPSTLTGTAGSGTNFSFTSSCGTFAAGSRWFRMTAITNAGIATVSTEGSTYDTVLGVYRGSISSPSNLVLATCNDNISSSNVQSRVQFQTQPETNYWLVVNATNSGTLKLTYGYDLSGASFTLNKTNRTVDFRSAPLPSLQYKLLASTNLTTNSAAWTVILTTNFSANTSASNNILRFVDTNVLGNSRRFFRIMLVP